MKFSLRKRKKVVSKALKAIKKPYEALNELLELQMTYAVQMLQMAYPDEKLINVELSDAVIYLGYVKDSLENLQNYL